MKQNIRILITSEIASGVVNGTNKIFTTTKSIYSINSIVVNGSEDAKYSFSGNTIIFVDAPSAGQVLVTYEYESNYDYLDNASWITDEVLSGEVNGTSRVFKSYYPIALIDEVKVNGVPVVGYSFNGNSVLLASAPTTGVVQMSYFRKSYAFNDYSANSYYTKAEVRQLVYDSIGQDETSVPYPIRLVDNAIKDGITELVTHVTDKSRHVSFGIRGAGYVELFPIDNTISSITGVYTNPIPPTGRLISSVDGEFLGYSAISSSKVLSGLSYNRFPTNKEKYYIGYKLPKNIKRVIGVSCNGIDIHELGSLKSFINGSSGYFINNSYIYLHGSETFIIEAELNEYSYGDDESSLIYIDKEDIGVIVYYALRQLYTEREGDKLQATSQIYLDKFNSYKKRMRKKRGDDKGTTIKTKVLMTR